MRLLLRCDAGPSTGVGHAVRCAALAEAAELGGHQLFWSGRLDGLDWLWAGLARTGWFAYTPLSEGVSVHRPGRLLPPSDTAAELVALCREHRIDAVHVDHYLLGPDLRDHLNAAGVVLSSVEDFHTGRRPADVVVDPNLGADAVPRPDDGSPVVLRGPRYAPLRESVRRARIVRDGRAPVGLPVRPGPVVRPVPVVSEPPGRLGADARSRPPSDDARTDPPGDRARTDPARRTPDRPRVLVVMGGTDAAGLLPRVVDALAAAAGPGSSGVPAVVDVVVPPGRELDLPAGFRAVAPLSDLPGAAAGVDLVVSAAGTTVWELCCVGVPMALVRAADNQTEGYRAVTAAGVAAGLGGAGDLDRPDARATLRRLLTDPVARDALAARARDVVDGLGVERVLAALSDAVGPQPRTAASEPGAVGPEPGAGPAPRVAALTVRTASGRTLTTRSASEDDAEMLLAWRNDPETRRWSRSSAPVHPAEHRAWLRRSLENGLRLLVVVEDGDGPVGTVRWDHDREGWEVSITVAPDRRGGGRAADLLEAGERVLRERTGGRVPLVAVVHRDNVASARLFARAGYRAAGPPDDDGFAAHHRVLA